MADSVPDDGRCSRNDGRRWRCSHPRFGGSRFCEGHFNYYHGKKSGAGSNSRVRVSSVPSIEKKKLGRPSTKSKPAVMRVQGEGVGKVETTVTVSADSEINEKKPIGNIVSEIKEKKKKKRGRPLIVKEGKKTAVAPNASGKKKKTRKSSGIEMTGEEEEAGRVMKLGQIWSFPKEAEGFPQSYARIDRIIPHLSTVQVTPLVPHPITDEEKLFLEQGLSLACGVFKASESTLCKEISAFTHKVMFEIEGKRSSFYKIFPKRGEIWAVYCKWDDSKKRFEYKLVELESDFNEEDGVKVFGLVQVEGVDGVYRRQEHDGFHLVRSFSRGFMSMFSHLVPTCRIVENGETRWKVMLH